MIMTSFVAVWLAFACLVGGLALYRNLMAHYREDDKLHLRDVDAPVVSNQIAVANRLDAIDRWGKTLTIGLFVLGVLLASVYIYQQWQASLVLPG